MAFQKNNLGRNLDLENVILHILGFVQKKRKFCGGTFWASPGGHFSFLFCNRGTMLLKEFGAVVSKT